MIEARNASIQKTKTFKIMTTFIYQNLIKESISNYRIRFDLLQFCRVNVCVKMCVNNPKRSDYQRICVENSIVFNKKNIRKSIFERLYKYERNY